MDSGLTKKLKELQRELLDLKSKQGYISVRSAGFKSQSLSAGTHTINYAPGSEPIITFIYAKGLTAFTITNITTPQNNSQSFSVSYTQEVQIISTRPIISIT